MGTAKAPGWAATSVEGKLERLNILASEDKHGLVVSEASTLVKQLLPRTADNLFKERYLEAYWHMVNSTYLYGKSKNEGSQMDRFPFVPDGKVMARFWNDRIQGPGGGNA
jgi:hypothetical protein